MPTICVQCALEAFVASDGQAYGKFFDETPEEHAARAHPEGVKPEDRQRLEAQAMEIIGRMKTS